MSRKLVCSILVAVFLAIATAGGAQTESGLSPSALARIGEGKSPAWVSGLMESMGALLRSQPVPRRALDLAADAVAGLGLPDDPSQAAALFHGAAREADLALRRGTPTLLARAEVRQRWIAMLRDSRAPASIHGSKAENALKQAGSESRRQVAGNRADREAARPDGQSGQGNSGR